MIERKVRAYDPWPRAATSWKCASLLLLKTGVYAGTLPEAAEAPADVPGTVGGADRQRGILVRTGGGILCVERLQEQFRKPMDWRSFLNGHPDFVDRQFNLDTERAVVIGNGNVALDVARMLLMSAERLRGTDVAEHALASLSRNQIREVVVVGRRGPLQASFTVPELLELAQLDDIDVAIECPREASWTDDRSAHPLRLTLLRELANRQPRGRAKRLVLRFLASPIELRGTEQVESLRLARNRLVAGPDGKVRSEPTDEIEVLPTGLVLRSVGYRATPPPAIPFDDAAGVVPNRGGRVIEFPGDTPLAGVYVAGWLKRGPSGFIGTNKLCSRQTVSSLLEDAAAGRHALPTVSPTELDALLVARQPARIDYAGWKRIDRTECRLGIEQGRTRRRLSHWQDLLGAAV